MDSIADYNEYIVGIDPDYYTIKDWPLEAQLYMYNDYWRLKDEQTIDLTNASVATIESLRKAFQ